MKVYIASALENAAEVARLRDILAFAGHVVTYDWTIHGSVQSEGAERIAEVAAAEMAGVIDADVLVALLPGGRGTHTEIGIALGSGVPVILRGAEHYARECAFYRAPGVIDRVPAWCSLEGIVAALTVWDARSSRGAAAQVFGPEWGEQKPAPAAYLPVPPCFFVDPCTEATP